jgi:hypothetical protein
MRDTSRSARISLVAKFNQLARRGDLRELMDYIGSDACAQLMAMLNRADRVSAAKVQFAAQESCYEGKPIPPRWSMRVKWTPEMIAKLRKAWHKHGTDEGIARELGIPYDNARRARRRFIGIHPSQLLAPSKSSAA